MLLRRALERRRRDPEGATLRTLRHRGQPRRRRQGALLVSRRDAHLQLRARALQVSAARLPLRRAPGARPRGEQGRRRARDPRYRRRSRTTATSTSSWSTRRTTRTTSSCASRRRTAARARRRWSCSRSSGSGTPGPGRRGAAPGDVRARHARRGAPLRRRDRRGAPRSLLAARRGRRGAALHGERVQRGAPMGRAQHRTARQGCISRRRRTRPPGRRVRRAGVRRWARASREPSSRGKP